MHHDQARYTCTLTLVHAAGMWVWFKTRLLVKMAEIERLEDLPTSGTGNNYKYNVVLSKT